MLDQNLGINEKCKSLLDKIQTKLKMTLISIFFVSRIYMPVYKLTRNPHNCKSNSWTDAILLKERLGLFINS